MKEQLEDQTRVSIGKHGRRTPRKNRVVNVLMCFTGVLTGSLFAIVPVILLFPDLLDFCIVGGTCGKPPSTGLDCAFDPSDPLCIRNSNENCKSSVWDAHGECCEVGLVDKCGICGGTATEIDNQGRCCSGSLDASRSCCYDGVNSWGLCGSSERPGSISVSIVIGSHIVQHIPKLLSILLGINETRVTISGESTVDFNIPSQRNLLEGNRCYEESPSWCGKCCKPPFAYFEHDVS